MQFYWFFVLGEQFVYQLVWYSTSPLGDDKLEILPYLCDWYTCHIINIDEFHNLLDSVVIRRDAEDSWIWTLNASNEFLVKSTYMALHNEKFGIQEVDIY